VKNLQSENRFDAIRNWFSSPLGRDIAITEAAILDELLAEIFGYHLLQLSISEQDLFTESPVGHKFKMGDSGFDGADVVGVVNELPFENDSIDVVLLQHLLDFYESPHPILREAARIVIPSGYLVVIGFNPWSLWGLPKLVPFLRQEIPWNTATIYPGRLMDWLTLLDFKIDRALYGYYNLPMRLARGLRLPDFSQGISRKINWPFGAIYVIVARKQVSSLTPIHPRWSNESIKGLSAIQTANRV